MLVAMPTSISDAASSPASRVRSAGVTPRCTTTTIASRSPSAGSAGSTISRSTLDAPSPHSYPAPMPVAIEGVPWDEVRRWYVTEGVTAGEIVTRLLARDIRGVTEASIRQRAKRQRWITVSLGESAVRMAEKTALTIAQRIARQEVANHSSQIKAKAREAIERCEAATLTMAEEFVSRAIQEAGRADVRELSSVASIGRAGVDVWRTSLGLNSTSSGSTSSAISISFVLKGITPRDTSVTLDAGTGLQV